MKCAYCEGSGNLADSPYERPSFSGKRDLRDLHVWLLDGARRSWSCQSTSSDDEDCSSGGAPLYQKGKRPWHVPCWWTSDLPPVDYSISTYAPLGWGPSMWHDVVSVARSLIWGSSASQCPLWCRAAILLLKKGHCLWYGRMWSL